MYAPAFQSDKGRYLHFWQGGRLFDKKLAIFQIWTYSIYKKFGGMTMQVAVGEFKSKCTKILLYVFFDR